MAFREVVDRGIEVQGQLYNLMFRRIEKNYVHVTAAGETGNPVGLGSFDVRDLREALDAVEALRD